MKKYLIALFLSTGIFVFGFNALALTVSPDHYDDEKCGSQKYIIDIPENNFISFFWPISNIVSDLHAYEDIAIYNSEGGLNYLNGLCGAEKGNYKSIIFNCALPAIECLTYEECLNSPCFVGTGNTIFYDETPPPPPPPPPPLTANSSLVIIGGAMTQASVNLFINFFTIYFPYILVISVITAFVIFIQNIKRKNK